MGYITLVEVIASHDLLIQTYGGSHGVRDKGAIEAAVMRPQSGYYEDSFQEAAALWESLMMNHGFIDGNKRVAVAAADIHLQHNGWIIEADPVEAWRFIDGLFADREMRLDKIEPWIRAHARRF